MGTRLLPYLSGGDVKDDDDDDKHECDDKDDMDDEKDNFGWYFRSRRHKAVIIHGTGKMIRIVFSSDHSNTKRGFFAKYSVTQGILKMNIPNRKPCSERSQENAPSLLKI